MTSFKMSFHSVTGRRMVEVWEGKQFIAAIYPDDGKRSIKIISKFGVTAMPVDDEQPAAMMIEFGANK
jgi:hypothetical protein